MSLDLDNLAITPLGHTELVELKIQDYLEVERAMDKDQTFQAVVLAMGKHIKETTRQLELSGPPALSQVEVELEAELLMEARPRQVDTPDMDQLTQPPQQPIVLADQL